MIKVAFVKKGVGFNVSREVTHSFCEIWKEYKRTEHFDASIDNA